MGRIRTIKPEVLLDAKAASLSDTAWRLWISSWLLADDAGRFPADPLILAGQVFPGRSFTEPSLSPPEPSGALTEPSNIILRAIGELVRKGMVKTYTVRGQQYGEITGWTRHQVINRPSGPKFPLPCETNSLSPHGALSEPSLSPHGGLYADLDLDLDRDLDLDLDRDLDLDLDRDLASVSVPVDNPVDNSIHGADVPHQHAHDEAPDTPRANLLRVVPRKVEKGTSVTPKKKRGATGLTESRPSRAKSDAPKFDFLATYKMYPRKIGKVVGLQKCTVQIRTVGDYEQLQKSVTRMQEAWAGATPDELRFCPHFSTFVAQKRYLDDEPPMPQKLKQNFNNGRSSGGGMTAKEIWQMAEDEREKERREQNEQIASD